MANMAARRAELLEDVAAQTATILAEFPGIDHDLREQIGYSLADHLADHWAGQHVYMPMDAAFRCSARERSILQERSAGTSIGDLARKYGMTERSIYRLLRRAALRAPAADQLGLFQE